MMESVPTEDAVEALMDHLLAPHLPARFPQNQPPSTPLQHTIGNQMHAVCLLYNYFHRRQNPHLEFLHFHPFCKVAVNANPTFLPLLKFCCTADEDEDESPAHLSITEQSIKEACTISLALHTFQRTPTAAQAWPVSKVAVFLIDSTQQNCCLASTATTPTLWSLIEKSLHNCNRESEAMQMENGNNKGADEVHWRQLAMSAVQEKTGIDPVELTVLESHVTYSLTEEKTTARFFIMKSSSVNNDVIQVPIKDTIERCGCISSNFIHGSRLEGPLVKNNFKRCVVTSVVEYFHLLPYVGMITSWFLREHMANASLLLPHKILLPVDDQSLTTVPHENINKILSPMDEQPLTTISHENINNSLSPVNDQLLTTVTTEKVNGSFSTSHISDFPDHSPMNTEHLDQKENGDCHVSTGYNIDDCRSYEFSNPYEERKNSSKVVVEEVADLSTQTDLIDKEDTVNPMRDVCNHQSMNVKVADGNNICSCGFLGQDSAPERDDHLVPSVSDSKDLEKIQAILAKEGNEILKDTLKGLLVKQKGLYHQQRQLEHEIGKCEKDIHTVLNEVCNAAGSRDVNGNHKESHYCFEGQHPLQCSKRMKLSGPIIYLLNPCQELDDICSENHWTLPRYSVFCTIDGFRADVAVQGIDFEFSVTGDVRVNAREARESAASTILSKLGSMQIQAP